MNHSKRKISSYSKSKVSPANENEKAKDKTQATTSDRVIQLLNEASMASVDSVKVQKLNQVQELVVNKEQALLDNFTDEVLVFQADRSHEVRKFVIGFMEEACKKDNELLTKVMANLNLLLADPNSNVIKKLIQSMTQLFRVVVHWLSGNRAVSDNHVACWKVVCGIKGHIYEFLDSENDGIRTQTVKFVEKIVLTLSELQRDSEIPRKQEPGSSLNEIPKDHELLKRDDLKRDSEKALKKLLSFLANPAISSVNLMATMGTLTTIAKQRPQFMGTVVQSFEVLHANLPPTLAKTQVSSVRKHLKMQLINMLRHIASFQYHPQITNLLYDLGTSSGEIAKNMPKLPQKSVVSSRKRSPESEKNETVEKKMKKDGDDSDEYEAPETSSAPASPQPVINQQNIAIDITAEQLVPLLTPENVANLVLLSMVMLPDKMPDAFQASYTPIESAGTEEQIGHLARLLSIQMTAMGIGSGVQKAAEIAAQEDAKRLEKRKQEDKSAGKKLQIQTVIGGTTKPVVDEEVDKAREAKKNIDAMISSQTVVPSRGPHRRIQGFKLEAITQPLSLEMKDKIIKMAVMRVLKSERNAIISGVHTQWQKILTSLVAQFGGDLHRSLAMFILEDMRSRCSLAFSWLYEEFNIYLENSRGQNDRAAQENYDACLTGLLQGLREKAETRDCLFSRLVHQAPLLTEGAIKQIRLYCEDEKRAQNGIKLVSKLLFCRPTRKMQFLRTLLDLCVHHKEVVQSEAVGNIKSMYEHVELQDIIRNYAVTHLQYLVNPIPPESLIRDKPKNEKKQWTESLMRQCLVLFLTLLPMDHWTNLIQTLAEVYVKTTAEVKRVILRLLDHPVSQMGMESPHLLKIVEGCPKGAETLITRMLHILTDKCHPSDELVGRVRDLYVKRVPDVRLLIPVLNGLDKNEVLQALPKLIRLNPPVVKGVFNRLLGVHRNQDLEPSPNSLTPVELLHALHNIDNSQVDVKSVIKATSLCFAEKAVYTSEVLVTVINQLIEQTPMPTLLMRTVIQSLITYPRLSGFVMNILQRLILKKVWEQEKVWEGFIRCCQRLKPQSFQVLLQLPSEKLSSVFLSAPELREPMLHYVERFTPQQRMHVNRDILAVLESNPTQVEIEQSQALITQQPTVELKLPAAESKVREEQQVVASTVQKQEDNVENADLTNAIKTHQEKDVERLHKEHEQRTKALEELQRRSSTGVKAEPMDSDHFPKTSQGIVSASQRNTNSAVEVDASSANSTLPVISIPPSVPSVVRPGLMPPASGVFVTHPMPGIQMSPALIPGTVVMGIPPPQVLTTMPILGSLPVKRERRSPTPTQDENPVQKE